MTTETGKAVFLSYASQDAEAARRICEALRASGVEVWFDQNELVGGDAWDAKIRKQIKECALFVPIISANTNARGEGYFRLEWKLAVDRSHLMAHDQPFLLPVVIDQTTDAAARVPPEFRAVQWTRLLNGDTMPVFADRVKQLLSPAEGGDASPGRPPRDLPADHRQLGKASQPKTRASLLVAGAVALLAVAAVILWPPRRNAAAPGSVPVVKSSASTEVQALLAKINAIVDKEADCTREDWALAESMGEQAVKLEPGNASAWACYANAASGLFEFFFDRERSPLADALTRAQKAVNLAPDATEAKFALANCYRLRTATMAEAEPILRELRQRDPKDRRVLRCLAALRRRKSDASEDDLKAALALYDQAGALPPEDPVSLREKAAVLIDLGRYAEADEALDRSLALRSGPAAMVRKISSLIVVHDDLVQACAVIDKLPGSYFLRDDVVEWATRAWLWSGKAARCFSVFSGVNGWKDDFVDVVPKGYIMGQALQMLGRGEGAKPAWRQALQAVERQIAATAGTATQPIYGAWKVRLLALLGEMSEAEAAFRTYEQTAAGLWLATLENPYVLLALKRYPETVAALEKRVTAWRRTGLDGRNSTLLLRASLRHGPEWEPLRGDPGFQALLEKMRDDPRFPRPAATATAAARGAEKSVAVLAFANLSADQANEYFSDGISEELLNALGRVAGLKVIGRTSSFSFKGRQVPAAEIARQLGVGYLVDGSVQKEGAMVRVSAQLINAADGFQLWSESFRKEMRSVLALQEEMAALIAQKLSLQLGARMPSAALNVNPEVFELYLEGRQAWNLRTTAGFAQAEERFNRALALDPNFARAQAGLVDVWTVRLGQEGRLSQFAQRDSAEVRRILAVARSAVELEPTLADAHAALGNIHWNAWNMADAARELQTAVKLNPSYASAHQWLGRVWLADGRMEESLAALRRAHELEPLAHKIADNLGIALIAAQRPTEALSVVERALALQPDSIWAQVYRAVCLAELGRPGEAIRAAAGLRDVAPNVSGGLSYACARAGARDETEKRIRELPVADRNAWLAAAQLLLGQREECWQTLESGSRMMLSVDALLFWPAFDPIRPEPRFARMLTELGLVDAHARAQAWRVAHPPEKARKNE